MSMARRNCQWGADICLDGKGEPMLVHGRILDTDGNPLDGVTIDVWQANDEGFYDVQQKGIQPDYNLRGKFTTRGRMVGTGSRR